MHSAPLNFIVRNREAATVHEQYLRRQVLFCRLRRPRIASLSAANFQPNNEDVSQNFLIGVRFVRDRARTAKTIRVRGKIATGVARKQNMSRAESKRANASRCGRISIRDCANHFHHSSSREDSLSLHGPIGFSADVWKYSVFLDQD